MIVENNNIVSLLKQTKHDDSQIKNDGQVR
jgi:hypothetical protein